MVTTTRLGLYRPIGTVSAPSSANGTTTTFKTLDANAGPFTNGTIFRLFDSGSNKKETTAFTVVSASSAAGTTTITFTPAAGVSTATTDIAYIPEISNVLTAISDQSQAIDDKAFVTSCTSGTRPGTPYTGQLIYETDTGNIMRYSGSVWTYVSNKNQPRGLMGFIFSTSVGTTIGSNQETAGLSLTFNAINGREYQVIYGGSIDLQAGNDASCYYRGRWALGGTVNTSSTIINTFGADVNDDSSGGTSNRDVIFNYTPALGGGTGQTTVGIFLGRANTGDAKTIRFFGYQYLAIEDVGSV